MRFYRFFLLLFYLIGFAEVELYAQEIVGADLSLYVATDSIRLAKIPPIELRIYSKDAPLNETFHYLYFFANKRNKSNPKKYETGTLVINNRTSTLLNTDNYDCISSEGIRIYENSFGKTWHDLNITKLFEPTGYVVQFNECCRFGGVNNLNLVPNSRLSIRMETKSVIFTGTLNNLPYFKSLKKTIAFLNETNIFDFSAIDYDGDELKYSLVDPVILIEKTVDKPSPQLGDEILRKYDFSNPEKANWKNGYSAKNPLKTKNGFELDSKTGFISFIPIEIGKYAVAVKVEDFRNGVKQGSTMREIMIEVLPNTTTSMANPKIFENGIESNNKIICQDDSVLLSTAFNTSYKYQWYREEEEIPNAVNDKYYAKDIGNYKVRITNANFCVIEKFSNSFSLNIKNPKPKLPIEDNKSICHGEYYELKPKDYIGKVDFLMPDGSIIPNLEKLNINIDGGYRMINRNASCPNSSISDGFGLFVQYKPKVYRFETDTLIYNRGLCGPTETYIAALYDTGYKFSQTRWFKNNVYMGPNYYFVIAGLTPGTYRVETGSGNCFSRSKDIVLKKANDCKDISYEQIYVPDVFTPNNADGINDELIIYNADRFPDLEFLLYDRWGKLVFKSKDMLNGPKLNAQYFNNGKVPPGHYVYKIIFNREDYTTKSGSLLVLE